MKKAFVVRCLTDRCTGYGSNSPAQNSSRDRAPVEEPAATEAQRRPKHQQRLKHHRRIRRCESGSPDGIRASRPHNSLWKLITRLHLSKLKMAPINPEDPIYCSICGKIQPTSRNIHNIP